MKKEEEQQLQLDLTYLKQQWEFYQQKLYEEKKREEEQKETVIIIDI